MLAFVVFKDDCTVPWLQKLLRPGFRHCWIGIRVKPEIYVTLDPLAYGTEVEVHHTELDLPTWHRATGSTVVTIKMDKEWWDRVERRRAPLELFTCVTTIKRILGIKNRWIMTPYSLYRHLTSLPTSA